MEMYVIKCVFLVSILLYLDSACALKCYTCSTTSTDYDDNCVSSPTEDMSRDCNKKYCNIIRVEDKDPKNFISSMTRGCSDVYMNGKTVDSTHIIYQMSCKEDFCNSGNGKTGSETHNYLGDKSTIYCPGTDSASSVQSSSFILLISSIVAIRFM